MSIPENITKEHLLAAISKIDNEGIPKDADSQYYDVVFDERNYPPKLIVSYANLFANGELLDRRSFDGGKDTPCFRLLEKNNFIIKPKNSKDYMTYFDELNKFLAQAQTNELGTISYLNNYQGLNVKVSFGKGNPARIPWIAFLTGGQTVQDGIYPVYLFYKQKKILILAYGLSETNRPVKSWNLPNAVTIKKYLEENRLGFAERYGSSLIYKVYHTDLPLDPHEISNDLNNLIAEYKETLMQSVVEKVDPISHRLTPDSPAQINFDHKQFTEAAKQSGLSIGSDLCLRFIASLLTKPFVILTGLSGSGKTKLAQAFASWICRSDEQYCIVPVGSDWTNREPLLGFPNSLTNGEYIKPDNRVLDLIIEASKNKNRPYFLILDEMNLSHVERYFADFLSVMETTKAIHLHSGTTEFSCGNYRIPASVNLPNNFFIIGTVNIDETTYMFSPKVLDRANVIEFRVTADEMDNFLQSQAVLSLDKIEGLGSQMAESFTTLSHDKRIVEVNSDELNQTLHNFFTELKKAGSEFGYRTAFEIKRFVNMVTKLEPGYDLTYIIDAAIMQKLLPKVHGARRKLEPILKTLGTLCLQPNELFENLINQKEEIDFTESTKIKYPLSLEKILRMNDNLIANGFTSYAEA